MQLDAAEQGQVAMQATVPGGFLQQAGQAEHFAMLLAMGGAEPGAEIHLDCANVISLTELELLLAGRSGGVELATVCTLPTHRAMALHI